MILRLHSLKVQISAIVAMVSPGYDATTHEASDILDPIVKVEGVAQNLLRHYLHRLHGDTHPGVKDRRIKQLEDTAAKYVLQQRLNILNTLLFQVWEAIGG